MIKKQLKKWKISNLAPVNPVKVVSLSLLEILKQIIIIKLVSSRFDFCIPPSNFWLHTCIGSWNQICIGSNAATSILTRSWRWCPTYRTGCRSWFVLCLPLQASIGSKAWKSLLALLALMIGRNLFLVGMVVMVWQAWAFFVFGATNWNGLPKRTYECMRGQENFFPSNDNVKSPGRGLTKA